MLDLIRWVSAELHWSGEGKVADYYAERGFTMIFSNTPFLGHQYGLDWQREEAGGNWYYSAQLDMEGWLCPALLRYFPEAPTQLFVQAKSRVVSDG